MEFHFIGPLTLISQPNFITECGVHVSILTICDNQIIITRINFKVNARETNIQRSSILQSFCYLLDQYNV